MDSSTLLSWNVQGLGGDKSRKVKGLFKQELSPQYVGKFDVSLMQEHHPSQNRVSKIRKLLKGKWFYDWIWLLGFKKVGLFIVDEGFL